MYIYICVMCIYEYDSYVPRIIMIIVIIFRLCVYVEYICIRKAQALSFQLHQHIQCRLSVSTDIEYTLLRYIYMYIRRCCSFVVIHLPCTISVRCGFSYEKHLNLDFSNDIGIQTELSKVVDTKTPILHYMKIYNIYTN